MAAKNVSGNVPFICFVNSDIEEHPQSSIAQMVNAFQQMPNIGVVGPKLLFPNNTIQSCGGYYDRDRGPYHRYLNFNVDYEAACTSGVVPWITGALIMTPKALFDSLGGFDEEYKRGYFEDVDYCERVKQQSQVVWYEASSVFIHQVGQSTKTRTDQFEASRQFRQNSVRFHKTWDAHINPNVGGKMVPY